MKCVLPCFHGCVWCVCMGVSVPVGIVSLCVCLCVKYVCVCAHVCCICAYVLEWSMCVGGVCVYVSACVGL